MNTASGSTRTVSDSTPAVQVLQEDPVGTATRDESGRETPVAPLPDESVQDEGQLVIFTEPEGARITVDGIGWGITPLTIPHLPLGDRLVRLTKDGYASEERVVRIEEGRSPVTITILLKILP
jgi:hypothetical protein